MSQEPLKIVGLKINNILRIHAVEITPTGDIITLAGKNKQGKSSILNCIAMTLGGADFIPERPIRDGESSGNIHIDMGDIIADVNFSSSAGKNIILRMKDGSKVAKPQTVLDSLWNKLCDPVRFLRLSESPEGRRKQATVLQQLVGLDFTKINADKKSAFDERTEVNRELEKTKAQLAGSPFHEDAPGEEQSVAALMTNLNEMRKHNSEINSKQNGITVAESSLALNAEEIEGLKNQITQLESQLTAKRSLLSQSESHHAKCLENIRVAKEALAKEVGYDTTAIETQITNADEVNAKVRANSKHLGLKNDVVALERDANELTTKIEGLEATKSKQLKAAKLPLPGLAWTDSGILLDGVPFEQGSQAEQLQAAIAIGLALNPRLRVILVRDASLFDSDSMKVVAEMAKTHQAQIWQEVISSDDESAIVIQDGEVV